MKALTVVKLGGSVITKKDEDKAEVRADVLARLAAEIAYAQAQKPSPLIVVHGAGPFGHVLARVRP